MANYNKICISNGIGNGNSTFNPNYNWICSENKYKKRMVMVIIMVIIIVEVIVMVTLIVVLIISR